MNEAEKLADNWEGAEEWMPLAWELCANECGEEACTELVWEGGPIPEPWGDRWLKYEGQAKEMIAMVRKLVPQDAALLRRQAEQIRELREATRDLVDCYCEIGSPMSKNDRMRHMLALNKARVLSNTKEET